MSVKLPDSLLTFVRVGSLDVELASSAGAFFYCDMWYAISTWRPTHQQHPSILQLPTSLSAFVLPNLNYCNSLLSVCSLYPIDRQTRFFSKNRDKIICEGMFTQSAQFNIPVQLYPPPSQWVIQARTKDTCARYISRFRPLVHSGLLLNIICSQ